MQPAAVEVDEEYLDEEDEARLREEQESRLAALAISLAGRRSEAINGRESSGIEGIWLEDEEQYEGIDDANRGELRAHRGKPYGQAMLDVDGQNKPTGSTVFINITRPYTDAASARVSDMLLPIDDRGWGIKPTPMPELAPIAEGNFPPPVQKGMQQQAMMQAQKQMVKNSQDPRQAMGMLAQAQQSGQQLPPEMMQQLQAGAQQNLGSIQQQAMDEAAQIMKQAKDKAEKAAKRIDDWHVECQYHAEMRSVIEDAAKVGTGILKGPFPTKRRSMAYMDGALVLEEKIAPASKRVNYWNLYPDPAAGENIHDGNYIWERDDITSKQLQDLMGLPGYSDEAIAECLKEGPYKATKEIMTDDDPLGGLIERDKRNMYEIWYFHGQLSKEDMIAAGGECSDELAIINVKITMVNNRIIGAAENPLDTGDFPYDIMVWQKRKGMPWGTGVPRHIRTPQRIVNGAGRNLMDNAGIAGGPQLIIKEGVVSPANGIAEFAPLKIWIAAEDADMDHLDNAFRFVVAPMLQAELQNIIMLGMKLAEDVTGLPQLMQGQMGQVAPDTVGGMTMLNNNANTVLRRIARLFDDLITEPHIRRYYAYLLQYGPEDDEKGDFQIDARGSSALIERDTQNQQMLQMAAIVANPIYGLDPKKWVTELLKSQRFDPNRFAYEDEEWQQIVQNLSQPQDSTLQVAQLRAEIEQLKIQSGLQDTQMKIQGNLQEAQMREKGDTERAALKLKTETSLVGAKIQADAVQNDADRQLEMMLAQMDANLTKMSEGGKQKVSFEDIKAMLAKTAMQLRTQKELAGMKGDTAAPQVATPAVEPAGRAPNGQAFQK